MLHLTCREYLGAYKVDVESFQVQDIIESLKAIADGLTVDITKVQLLTSLRAHADTKRLVTSPCHSHILHVL